MKSCSVPHWMSVVSNWPPMPIHSAENVLVVEGETAETFHDAVIPVTVGWGFCRFEATT